MMQAIRNLPALAVVTIDYDSVVDYASAPTGLYVLLRDVVLGETITPNDLIQFGMIYHVDTDAYAVGDRLPQGWVKRSDAINGIITVDLSPVVRALDYQYAGDPITLSPPAYTISSFFVDIDIWSEGTEYETVVANGLVASVTPLIIPGNGARLRINYLAQC